MRSLDVDFAPPARWPVVTLWTLVACMLVGAAFLAAVDAREWRALAHRRDDVAALHAQLDSTRAQQASRAASAVESPAYAIDARRLKNLATADVAGVLRSIESARVPGARVLALDVDAEGRRIELQLDVTSADVAASYVQALNAGLDPRTWSLVRLQIQGSSQTAVIHGQLP